MRVIGITGGIGSGKSRILDYLLTLPKMSGIFTDDVAKELMKPGEIGYKALVKVLGESCLSSTGELDKNQMIHLFENENFRNKINGIIHPLVIEKCKEMIENLREQDFIFLESAILFEAKADQLCDEVWYVDASKQTRINRLMENRKYSYEEALNRIHAQKGQELNKIKSNFIIQNNQDFEYVTQILRKKLATYENL